MDFESEGDGGSGGTHGGGGGGGSGSGTNGNGGDDGSGSASTLNIEQLDSHQRAEVAVRIVNEGLESLNCGSWVDNPPVADSRFLKKLESEKTKKRVSRIKLDPFHW